jgi:hypothetical protein
MYYFPPLYFGRDLNRLYFGKYYFGYIIITRRRDETTAGAFPVYDYKEDDEIIEVLILIAGRL